ncbi:MAG: DUF262 domain-containing protein [Gammaproteobacteria bacterium]|nr:DUF262 domain-containing protein [Gammaproteobacteria bacterium]MDE0246407.1 DUF262 domain-containing protein [Gammaproteobacteria bacterium]
MENVTDVKLITGAARTVRQLFTGPKYGLDYYQREYNWSESNVTEMVDDLTRTFLVDFDESDERKKVASYRQYFLGPIVTSSAEGVTFIVDGQQRLTTLTLILIHLIHLSNTIGRDTTDITPLVFSKQYGDKTFNINVNEREDVMRSILDGTSFDSNDQSESVRNIWNRYQLIVTFFPDDLKDTALPYFCDWLIDRVVLVEIGPTDQDMALEIFETMNDRGQRLSNTDMLKGFLLARMSDPDAIDAANQLWRDRITALKDIEKNADSELLKHWLRGKYARTIRERKKDAVPRDFDLIGTAFHKWVRDHRRTIGLRTSNDYITFVSHDFERMSRRYMWLQKVSHCMTVGWEHVYYNTVTGFTLQYLPIMAAVTPDDDDDTFRAKAHLVAGFLDLFVARRMVNNRNFGYSTVVYTMFNLAKSIRNKDLDTLRDVLADRVADIRESFNGVTTFRLTQRNGRHIRYLLARMTAWIEGECNTGVGFERYVNWKRRDPFEVEHIWADRYERDGAEFDNPYDFADQRNRFGGLLLLPRSFNASFGDAKYEDKVPHYFGQNLLAKSLNSRAYENNPAFVSLARRVGLPFVPYPDRFTRSDMDERQELYRQVCEQVWNPEELGLGGGTPSDSTTKAKRRAFYRVSLANLIQAGLLECTSTIFT